MKSTKLWKALALVFLLAMFHTTNSALAQKNTIEPLCSQNMNVDSRFAGDRTVKRVALIEKVRDRISHCIQDYACAEDYCNRPWCGTSVIICHTLYPDEFNAITAGHDNSSASIDVNELRSMIRVTDCARQKLRVTVTLPNSYCIEVVDTAEHSESNNLVYYSVLLIKQLLELNPSQITFYWGAGISRTSGKMVNMIPVKVQVGDDVRYYDISDYHP